MATANLDQDALKREVKEELAETFQEQRDLFHEIFAEVLAVPRVGVYPGNRPAVLRVKTARWYQPVRTSRVFPTLRRLARR